MLYQLNEKRTDKMNFRISNNDCYICFQVLKNVGKFSAFVILGLTMAGRLVQSSGVARGGGRCGRSATGGKIKVIPKSLEREKLFRGGEKFQEGVMKEPQMSEKQSGSKKFWGVRQQSRGAANLRSAPGGRHTSYVTGRKLAYIF